MKKIIVRIIMLLILGCSSLQAAKVWDVGDPIQAGTVTSPVYAGRYLCGSGVDFSVSGTEDNDHWCDTGTEGDEPDCLSGSYPQWTASAGSWKDGDYIGEDVVWLAPNAPTTNISVHMYDDDSPNSIPTGESGTRDDASIDVSIVRISAIKPYLYAANYGGDHPIHDVEVPEYSYPDSRNDPSAYSMGADPYVSVKFSCSYPLTQAEDNIVVTGQTSGDAYNIGDWDMPGTTTCTWSTWPTSYINFESGSDIDYYVTYKDYTTGWYYRCEDGTDTWILMTEQSSRLYVVYDDPLCDYYIFNKNNLNTVIVEWANGCTKVDTSNDSDNIPRKVQLGARNWFSTYGYDSPIGILGDPFEYIPEVKGDCLTYADLMTKGLLILGVPASTVGIKCIDGDGLHAFFTPYLYPFWSDDNGDADGDGTLNKNESGWSNGTGTLESIYIDADAQPNPSSFMAENYPWNVHGACNSAGHWWEITGKPLPEPPIHDTQENMLHYPNGLFIDYPSVLIDQYGNIIGYGF